MQTLDEMNQAIDSLVNQHYYSEDFELEAAMRAFYERLSDHEQAVCHQALIERLRVDPSILTVSLCSQIPIPEAAPLLASALNGEKTSSQRTRSIMAALRHYDDAHSFTAVERFLESDQEPEALQQLARIDFNRVRPHLMRAMTRPHLHPFCLQIFHEQRKRGGLEALADTLASWAAPDPETFEMRLRDVLSCKKGDYNPFSIEEQQTLLRAVHPQA